MMTDLYAILLVAITLATVLSRRTMYSILYLILLFVLVALVVMSFKIDFIGLIFIIVYVGAIATLFLFIIMMLGGEDGATDPSLDLDNHQLLQGSGFSAHGIWSGINKAAGYIKHIALDLVIALALGVCLVEVFSVELAGNFEAGLNVTQTAYASGLFNTAYLYGVFFYNHGYIPFIMAAVVLLIAMLGSIILTTRLILMDNKPTAINKSTDEMSPIEKLQHKQKLEEKANLKAIPFHVVWFVLTLWVSGYFKDFFIVSATARNVYVAICASIFMGGSLYIDYRSKRNIK